jgi:hypothetical protein
MFEGVFQPMHLLVIFCIALLVKEAVKDEPANKDSKQT